jgi:hypothetical protein
MLHYCKPNGYDRYIHIQNGYYIPHSDRAGYTHAPSAIARPSQPRDNPHPIRHELSSPRPPPPPPPPSKGTTRLASASSPPSPSSLDPSPSSSRRPLAAIGKETLGRSPLGRLLVGPQIMALCRCLVEHPVLFAVLAPHVLVPRRLLGCLTATP